MALAARARGYAYMALTDHSRSLAITNGLSLERLEEARRAVAQVNEKLAPFVVLLGTEMDILVDGSLDYPDETLASLDYVSASVHSRFKQAEPEDDAAYLAGGDAPAGAYAESSARAAARDAPVVRGGYAAGDSGGSRRRVRDGGERRPGAHGLRR